MVLFSESTQRINGNQGDPRKKQLSLRMKPFIKRFLLAAAFGLWTSAATGHHISGMVVCIDSIPVIPLSGVAVSAQGASGTFTATTGADGLFFISLPTVTDTYTITIATPAGST